MFKLIIWIVVVLVVLFGLRLINVASAKRRRDSLAGDGGKPANQMVRCVRCGIFLPQADAKRITDGFVCSDASCGSRH